MYGYLSVFVTKVKLLVTLSISKTMSIVMSEVVKMLWKPKGTTHGPVAVSQLTCTLLQEKKSLSSSEVWEPKK